MPVNMNALEHSTMKAGVKAMSQNVITRDQFNQINDGQISAQDLQMAKEAMKRYDINSPQWETASKLNEALQYQYNAQVGGGGGGK